MIPSPVLDATALTQLGEQLGDLCALHQFVDRYLAMLDRRVERMCEALKANDLEAWLDAALSLGSASAMLGAAALSRLARQAYAELVARPPAQECWPNEQELQAFVDGLRLTAAETGHLVFGTLHTSSAAKTVDRIINVFPADEQEQVRAMLAETLRGVVAQQLLRKADGSGRVAALEIMVGTPAIANMIREAKTHQITSMIQTGRKDGMQLMDQAILDYLMKKIISPEEAYARAHSKAEFLPYLDGGPVPAM